MYWFHMYCEISFCIIIGCYYLSLCTCMHSIIIIWMHLSIYICITGNILFPGLELYWLIPVWSSINHGLDYWTNLLGRKSLYHCHHVNNNIDNCIKILTSIVSVCSVSWNRMYTIIFISCHVTLSIDFRMFTAPPETWAIPSCSVVVEQLSVLSSIPPPFASLYWTSIAVLSYSVLTTCQQGLCLCATVRSFIQVSPNNVQTYSAL